MYISITSLVIQYPKPCEVTILDILAPTFPCSAIMSTTEDVSLLIPDLASESKTQRSGPCLPRCRVEAIDSSVGLSSREWYGKSQSLYARIMK